MNTKFLIIVTWLFYIALRRSGGDGWLLFCTILSGLITACSFLYRLENKPGRHPARNKKAT
jgi:peptidoglycan/LPS O-acetylase OafA/YrhL